MADSTSHSSHPLPFLLYLEWILLGLIAIAELINLPRFQLPHSPLFNLVGLALFGAMGLWLPLRQQSAKLFYTAAEIALLVMLSFVGHVRLFSLLYLVVVTRNCLIFQGQRWRWVTVSAFVLFLVTQLYRVRQLELSRIGIVSERIGILILSLIVLFGLTLVFLQLLVDAVLSERRSREQLAAANAQLRQYALRVEDLATLQERNRIAREIHDSLGHSLTALNLHLEATWKLWPVDSTRAKAFLGEARQMSQQALSDVRHSVTALRSDPLQGQSLEQAIAPLIEDFQRTSGITPIRQIHLPAGLPSEVNVAVYRIMQEAFTNICKHAHATQVTIHLFTDTHLHLAIQDNGDGFDQTQTTTGFGLQGMRERATALGGTFHLTSTPGAGSTLTVTIPLTGGRP